MIDLQDCLLLNPKVIADLMMFPTINDDLLDLKSALFDWKATIPLQKNVETNYKL